MTSCQGVVCSLKDGFGFIERADVVKEIFFHFVEFKGNVEELMLGDDVEFNIQRRNGKDTAINIRQIPEGSVIFEDVGIEKMCGQVTKTLHMSTEDIAHSNEPLFGRIVYQNIRGAVEILFSERDRIGDFTLLVGDVVEFYIATDRRDKLQRATNIKLLESTFLNNCEKRERGFVVTLKEHSGYICSVKSNHKIVFHTNEVLDPAQKLTFLDEVEFTVAEDVADCKVAIRIKILPCGSIERNWKPEKYFGIVQKKSERASKTGTDHFEPGIIAYELSGTQHLITYFPSAVIQGCRLPIVGDMTEFQIIDGPTKDSKVAANIKLKSSEIKRCGFVAGIKDGVMWIELIGQKDLISFKSNLINANFHLLKVGDEIEFVCSNKSIDNICLLADGTIPHEACLPLTIEGKIIRCINSSEDCNVESYSGLIQPLDKNSGNSLTVCNGGINDFVNANNASSNAMTGDGNNIHPYPSPGFSSTLYSFRLSSLIDRRDLPLVGEIVRFQPIKPQGIISSHVFKFDKFQLAGMVVSMKRCLYARVENIKGQVGTLNYELANGSKLNFSLSEVLTSESPIQSGDLVEFVGVVKNNKFMAVGLHKVDKQQRPDRLVSRLKTEDHHPRITTLRAPRGPDGSRGFNTPRQVSDLIAATS